MLKTVLRGGGGGLLFGIDGRNPGSFEFGFILRLFDQKSILFIDIIFLVSGIEIACVILEQKIY